MDPTRLMTLTGTIVTRAPSGTDQYGGAVLTEVETPAMLWYGSPSTEERAGLVYQVLTVYCPPGTPLDNVTAIDLPGLGRYEVDGSPMEHVSPRTRVPTHVTIRVRRGA